MDTKKLLGELLVQQNLVDQDTINDALRVQVGGNRRLGTLLVRMGKLSEDRLVEVLAAQLNMQLTDIKNNFSAEVKGKLPRYLCRKYDIIPLKLKNNNILEIAMSDPSDYQAINDLERYTGNVVEPRLARHSDIAVWTTKLIPYSLRDFFSPEASVRFTRIAIAVSLILVVVIGGISLRFIHEAKYGTVSISNEATIYKNHDLLVGIDKRGAINLMGRGAFAQGYYAASFQGRKDLESFIAMRNSDLSEKQKEWLEWVINKIDEKN